jgi:two-component system NtrC family sensor kinase
MKKKLLAFLSIFSMCVGFAQQQYSDSLKQASLLAKEDSSKVFALCKLSAYYSFVYPDSAMSYAEEVIAFSKKQKYPYGEALGLLSKGEAFDRVADFPSALEAAYNSLQIARTLGTHRLYMMSRVTTFIAHLNHMTGNDKKAAELFYQAIDQINQSGEHKEDLYSINYDLAFVMLNLDKKDSALFYLNKGKEFLPVIKKTLRQPTPWLISGNVYYFTGQIDSAEKYFREGLKICEEYNCVFLSAILYNVMGTIYFEKNMRDSCIYYKRKSLLLSRKYKYKVFEMEASGSLADFYRRVNADSALKYIYIMLAAKDEIGSDSRLRQFQQVSFQDEKKQREIEDAKAQLKNRVKIYALIGALVIFSIIAFIFWRNNKQRKKANLLLQQQKEKVELTLSELKSTQVQLIQSEKMASLGELTAGIAHEIQNPLNFVNNFSEVTNELIDEMNAEIEKGDLKEAKLIAHDIKQNLEKINHHGKRADAIVKGMLQHSRSSSGVKEPTDINALADEYLRLAYHGLRAKDKSFNATMKTDFDESIGKINIVPQEIGRVILNLINNAFYAASQPSKGGLSNSDSNKIPTVWVSTKKDGNKILISVRDNGPGIPESIKEKIFQPFFTTKPTGQGTGLGLSLSYDIIKAHGGEIKVESKEEKGTIFIITLAV